LLWVLWCLSPRGLLMWAWNIIGNPDSVYILCFFRILYVYVQWFLLHVFSVSLLFSVGFYQMAKIAVTPTIVAAEFMLFQKKVSFQKVRFLWFTIVLLMETIHTYMLCSPSTRLPFMLAHAISVHVFVCLGMETCYISFIQFGKSCFNIYRLSHWLLCHLEWLWPLLQI
jgi:hypothetical protein